MTQLARLRSWLKSVCRRSRLESDMDSELRFHIESRAEELARRGMPAADAQRRARLEFGTIDTWKDGMRTSVGLRWWDELRNDLRFAWRTMARSRGFTAAAVLTLALGIGANTAIFTVVNATLIRPLPYVNADRLVMVWETRHIDSDKPNVTSPATFLNWQERNSVFEEMSTVFNGTSILTGGDVPEQVPVQMVSANFFAVLGVNAAMGRVFNPAQESAPGADQVTLLSFEMWQRRFGGNPAIVGSQIMVDGEPLTVIGVMPRDFQFFVREGSLGQEKPALWVPMIFDNKARAKHGRYLQTVARLRPGVTLDQARSAMSALSTQLAREDPNSMKDWRAKLVPLRDQLVGGIEPGLKLLLAAVAVVLLIACANVATLFLARAMARRHEIAIRTALGATAGRVARQTLTESCLLAVSSGVCGAMLALLAVKALQSLAPANLVPLQGIHVDARVLGFTIVISLMTGLLFGLVPAIQAARLGQGESLQEGRTVVGGGQHNRMRNAFAVVQVALALILLTGSGLLIRSFSRLVAVDPGFQADHVLTARVHLPNDAYKDEARRGRFYDELLRRIRQIPGVGSASANSFLPFSGIIAATGVDVEGRPALPIAEAPVVDVALVEPQFFETMAIPLLQGRTFTEREATEVSHKVVISQAMARQLWPNENPIGKHVTIHMKREDTPSEVIGVVRDVKHAGLDAEVHPTAYWPYPELAFGFMTLVVRTDGDPLTVVPELRQAVLSVDKNQPLADVAVMEDLLSASTAGARFATLLMSAFAALALILAMLGIYAVASYNVAERTREIGIRIAFGASTGGIQRMLLKQGLTLALCGALIGAAGSLAVSRLLAGRLFATKPYDPATFAAVAGVLVSTALTACYLGTRRATSMDAMQALRCD